MATKLALKDLIVDPAISIRRRLNEQLVEDYMPILENLPAVLAYATPEGKLLTDGFHRYEAAVRRGWTHIKAEVRKGTRKDALTQAVLANLAHGMRLTAEERRDAVLRIAEVRGWNADKIADATKLPVKAVETIIKADQIRADVPEASALPDTHSFILSKAPAEHRASLATVATQKGWTADELRTAVQNIKNPEVAQSHKEALLRGASEPIATHGGEPTILKDTVARRLAQARREDLVIPLWEGLERLARLRGQDPETIAQKMKVKDLEHLRRELPADIEWLQRLLEAAGRVMEQPRVVKIR